MDCSNSVISRSEHIGIHRRRREKMGFRKGLFFENGNATLVFSPFATICKWTWRERECVVCERDRSKSERVLICLFFISKSSVGFRMYDQRVALSHHQESVALFRLLLISLYAFTHFCHLICFFYANFHINDSY